MKQIQKNPFRIAKEIPEKYFVTAIIKLKKEHILIIPDEIVKVFDLQIGDIAIFESWDKCIKIKFVKKTMFSFVKKLDIKKLMKDKKIKFSLIRGNLESDSIVFGKKVTDKMGTH
ncbi:hypothetical protein HYS31_07850 [Candidatus Woesearchaeota archaeon]|nr:hypothetical protein [Candidatus Woesearchaeota archaeon]